MWWRDRRAPGGESSERARAAIILLAYLLGRAEINQGLQVGGGGGGGGRGGGGGGVRAAGKGGEGGTRVIKWPPAATV